MNAELLLRHFKRIADCPTAVPRLRNLVFEMATNGKLVPTESSWESRTLGELGQWGSGGTPLKTHSEYYGGDIPWLVIGDLNDGVVTKAATSITPAGLANSSAKLIEPGTVLIAMYGSIGKLGISAIRCATNQAIAFCIPNQEKITNQYLFIILRSLRDQLLDYGQGIAQQNISQKILKAHPLKLPSLAEQHRIVAKVDELMALCDQLEAARTEREAARDRLTSASLARLNAPDPETFLTDACFALDALPAVTARADQIKQLRQTILDLAMSGKLVEQDSADEPASELLKRIAEKREQLVSAGEIKARKIYARDRREPLVAMLPKTWILTDLGAISFKITDGAHKTPTYVTKGVPFVSVKDFSSGQLDLSNTRFIPESEHEVLYKRCDPRRGDILLGRIGTLGKAVLVDTDVEFSLFVSVGLIRFDHECLLPEFFRILLNSPFVDHEFDRIKVGGGTHTNKLNLGDLHTVAAPLPPLAEQRRIVAKVDELMALCDQLEASLATADDTRRRLLEALLAEALQPALQTAA